MKHPAGLYVNHAFASQLWLGRERGTVSEVTFKVQDRISGRRSSPVRKYQLMVIGSDRWWDLIKYELILLVASRLPGTLGVLLRGKLYPLMLGEVGRDVVFGANITLRHPHKIRIGDGVIVDDNVVLDAKGDGNQGITIGRNALIGRNAILNCKDGDIELGERAEVGSNSQIFSAALVRVGRDVLISAYALLVGGGNYELDRTDVPISQTVREGSARGIHVGDDVRVGAHAVILDGVSVGEGSVVAAGAVVKKDVRSWSAVAGVPVSEERALPEVARRRVRNSQPTEGSWPA